MLRGSKHIASILTIVPEAPYLKEGFYQTTLMIFKPFLTCKSHILIILETFDLGISFQTTKHFVHS